MFSKLLTASKQKQSLLCIGLDPVYSKLPTGTPLTAEGCYQFCYDIVVNTFKVACAYKINLAFWESLGLEGLEALQKLRQAMPPDIYCIGDAKRADIGETSQHGAKWLYDQLNFDAVTLSPYMGEDALLPYLQRPDKDCFVLCRTSNPGSHLIQEANVLQGGVIQPLYAVVAQQVARWGLYDNKGLVMGATNPQAFSAIRYIAPHMPLLVPGIGHQGGDVERILRQAGTENIIFSSSRDILYAANTYHWRQAAKHAATKQYDRINQALENVNEHP